MKVVVLELNELNFHAVEYYAARDGLPHFRDFFDRHGYCETTSEARYEEVEPWIQWVTVHTGLSFAQHGIFRLGDVVTSAMPQIWERMERDLQLKVGAVSPMNAANRTLRPAYFIPDPWTPTAPSGSWLTRRLSNAISQAVRDNASSRMTPSTFAFLTLGLLRYALMANYRAYLSLASRAVSRSWNRASFLDLFLSDVFVGLTKKTQPEFCTLFLNGAAHLQHHYMFNSPAWTTPQKNPSWYVKSDADPVGEIYAIYDRILGSVQRELPDYRVLLVTGLHQDPHGQPEFYWRLRSHADFLRRLGVRFDDVEPRMSRDFVVRFGNREDLDRAASLLLAARIEDEVVFTIEKRERDIFVEFVFGREITGATVLRSGVVTISGLDKHVVFVALKNGHHNPVGYFSDGGRDKAALPRAIPLARLHDEMLDIFRGGGTASLNGHSQPLSRRVG